jgi:hypothetical protein
VKIRSGYGLEFLMRDDNSQITTQRQYIQIYCPHNTNCRGPHIHKYQEAPSGPGLVFLRVAGNHIIATTDDQVEIIGDIGGCSTPHNKIEMISKLKLVYTRDFYVNITKKSHIFYAKDFIALLAGKDGPKNSPRIGRLCVYDMKTGTVRLSSKIVASVGKTDPCMSITHILPFAKKRCNPANETSTAGGA